MVSLHVALAAGRWRRRLWTTAFWGPAYVSRPGGATSQFLRFPLCARVAFHLVSAFTWLNLVCACVWQSVPFKPSFGIEVSPNFALGPGHHPGGKSAIHWNEMASTMGSGKGSDHTTQTPGGDEGWRRAKFWNLWLEQHTVPRSKMATTNVAFCCVVICVSLTTFPVRAFAFTVVNACLSCLICIIAAPTFQSVCAPYTHD